MSVIKDVQDLSLAEHILADNQLPILSTRSGNSVKVYQWDGKKYDLDNQFSVFMLAIEGVKKLINEQEKLLTAIPQTNETEKRQEKKILNMLKKYQNHNKAVSLEKMISKLSAREATDFDSDLRHLNMQNGVYDLVEHRLLPHSAEYLNTLITPYGYNPGAKAPEFEALLKHMFDNDTECIEYVLEVIGSCIGRKRFDENIFIIYGPTASNGKTTMMEAVTDSLGTGPGAMRCGWILRR